MESLRKEAFEKSLNELNIPLITGDQVTKIQKVGEGAFGEVFRGKFGEIDVAIKQIKIDAKMERDTREDVYKTILNEIQVMLLADSTGIPKFFGLWKNDNCYHLIFEFIFGKSFRNCHQEMDKVSKLRLIHEFLTTLAQFHDKKLIHRDIKPDNIMVESKTNRPILIDFGVSKIARKTATFTQLQRGTIMYISPEMYFDEDEDADQDDQDAKPVPVSTYCDIWSVGCMISEIFSGILPWNTERLTLNQFQIEGQMVNKKKFPIPQNLDADIKELVESTQHLDYTQRPNARELQSRIEKILENYK